MADISFDFGWNLDFTELDEQNLLSAENSEKLDDYIDNKGYLILNKKTFRKKDRNTIAAEFENYDIMPLISEIQAREKSLFDNEINRLESYRKTISETISLLTNKRFDFVSKHSYMETKEKSLSKAEMLEAMTYAKRVYNTYSSVGNSIVDHMRKMSKHIEQTGKSQSLESCKEYFEALDNDLQINKANRPFYSHMQNGEFITLKSKILFYYREKYNKEYNIKSFVRGLLIFLTLPCIILSGIIYVFWTPEKYNESETEDKFDSAVTRKIKLIRGKYLPEMYKSVNDKCEEIAQCAKGLAEKGGEIFQEALYFLPKEYRNFVDIENLHRILTEGYAENIREAFMVYENEKMRQQQQEQIEESKRQMIEQNLAMLNILKSTIMNTEIATQMAVEASNMAINAQESAIEARKNSEEANKRVAALNKANQENALQLAKLKSDSKDAK